MLSPLDQANWNYASAAHLLSRAGFGGTPAEVAQLATLTPEQAVTKLLSFTQHPDLPPAPAWVGPDSDLRPQYRELKALPETERKARADAMRAKQMEEMVALRAWWLQRMLTTTDPLQEKLTLFWHGHFATSIRKVRSSFAMYRQNQTFRRLAAGNWRTLVHAAAQEPAMLIYLDNAQSRAQAPNENFARELMELFTLGEGHYTEQDVHEGARALTGWSLDRDRLAFRLRPGLHDDGAKEFLGRKGNLDGDDVIDAILAQPVAAEFIARKLWSFFAYPDPDADLVTELATTLRRDHYELRPLLARMFGSAEFYGPRAVRTQIKSPVQWLTGSLKVCELALPPARPAERGLRDLGQDLFAPPNVKGWDGGLAWINAATLVKRYNFAGLLINGRAQSGGDGPAFAGLDGARVLPPTRRATRDTARQYLQLRIFLGPLRAEDEKAISDYIASLPEPQAWSDAQVRDVVRFMMSTPQFQLT